MKGALGVVLLHSGDLCISAENLEEDSLIYKSSFISAVHAKSLVAILHLLVALSQYFRAPIRLPDHVSIQVVVVQVS